MRPGPCLLLLLLLSTPAAARDGSGGRAFHLRTLVAPVQPAEVPPLELRASAGLTTLVQFDPALQAGAVEFPEEGGRVQLARLGDDSLVVALTRNLAPDEQVPFTVALEPGAQPLRFVVVTRRESVDLRVHVERAPPSAGEVAAEHLAREFLSGPQARMMLAQPQQMRERGSPGARARVQSVVWMGPRLFAIAAVLNQKKGTAPWRLVQARLRTTLADDVLLEWPARLLPGPVLAMRQLHVLTSLLPEGASGLEVALDGEDSPGDFQPLPPATMDESP